MAEIMEVDAASRDTDGTYTTSVDMIVTISDSGPPSLDLRSLEYVEDYDNNLMCPICQVPLIEPVVLECDHTFCKQCLHDYSRSGLTNARRICPSCRNVRHKGVKEASRLIKNMCDDVQVRCPHDSCEEITTRSNIARHVEKECLERSILCPEDSCSKDIRARNVVPGQCIHITTIECDCGAIVPLGRGEWLLHKDTACPNVKPMCTGCGQYNVPNHKCMFTIAIEQGTVCPGVPIGCEFQTVGGLELHIKSCVFAKLAPLLNKQNQQVSTFFDTVKKLKDKNRQLEIELDLARQKINHDMDQLVDMLDNEEVEEVARPVTRGYPQYRGRSRPRSPYPYPSDSQQAVFDAYPYTSPEFLPGHSTNREVENLDPL
ncbi:hypothetical protein LTR66_017923, partial [Elasticomyces elasticus]